MMMHSNTVTLTVKTAALVGVSNICLFDVYNIKYVYMYTTW